MFPYDQAPVSDKNTSLEIEKLGKQALLRSLNIGRAVALIGSGASLGHGQPPWAEFKQLSARIFFQFEYTAFNSIASQTNYRINNEELVRFFNDYQNRLFPLSTEIRELYLAPENTLEPLHYVELCEKYFEGVKAIFEIFLRIIKPLDSLSFVDINTENLKNSFTSGDDHHIDQIYKQIETLPPGLRFESVDLFDDVPLDKQGFRDIFSTRFKSLIYEKSTADSQRNNTQNNENKNEKKVPVLRRAMPFDVIVDANQDKGMKAVDQSMLIKIQKDVNKTDVARSLFRVLGIHRFLTLNYDIEIEKMLLEESRSTPLSKYRGFESFVNHKKAMNDVIENEYDEGAGRAVSLASASGRVVRSTSSRAKTLADLFAFGAFPTNYDSSVHHLHGRVDDPGNMIITPRDYQGIYYGNSEQKKSFDEARHAVFTGSDIIIVGLGYGENDVLKPLRDLLEFESNRIDSFGKVFYVTSAKFDRPKTMEQATSNAVSQAKCLTQRLFQEYGMHVLHADLNLSTDLIDSTYSKEEPCATTRRALFQVRAELNCYFTMLKDLVQDDSNSEYLCEKNRLAPKEKLSAWRELSGISNDILKSEYLNITDAALEIIAIREGLRTMMDAFVTGAIQDKDPIKKYLRAVDSLCISLGLVNYVKSLSEQRQEWWTKWSTRPGPRLAMYGYNNYRYKEKKLIVDNESEIGDPLVWRQTNMATYFGPAKVPLGTDNTPQFSAFLHQTIKAREDATRAANTKNKPKYMKWAACVVRISMPPGSGKGRLVSFYSHKQRIHRDKGKLEYPFVKLFQRSENDSEAIGLYSAHLTFSLEFSSLITGLIRFIQLRLPQLREHSGTADKRWDEFLDVQLHLSASRDPAIEVLSDMFQFLQDVCPAAGWGKRMTVIISNLDRMVDSNGDGYAPIHRLFFRLVTGWRNSKRFRKLPIDFILINNHADHPIRYLSEERTIKGLSKLHKHGNWLVRADRNCALKYWGEIQAVSKQDVFNEGLLFTLVSLRLAQSSEKKVFQEKSLNRIISKAHRDVDVIGGMIESQYDHRGNWSLDLPTGLWAFLERRVSHGYMLAALTIEIWDRYGANESNGSVNLFRSQWREITLRLAGAISRNRTYGYFDELFNIYRYMDRGDNDSSVSDNASFQSTDATEVSNFTAEDTVALLRKNESPSSIAFERLSTLILDHLALFAYPVAAVTLCNCPEIRVALAECYRYTSQKTGRDVVGDILRKMAQRGLVARFWKYSVKQSMEVDHDDLAVFQARNDQFVYGVDPKVGSVIRAKANLAIYGFFNVVPFQTSLYMSQPENSVKPEISHFHRVSDVVRSLIKTPHKELLELLERLESDSLRKKEKNADDMVDQLEKYADMLRSAYALIRGTFSISVISRLDPETNVEFRKFPFDEYRTWIRKSLNTATLLTHLRKKLGLENNKVRLNEPFFREEISWLYNERALVSFIQGRLFDALPLFDQALAVTSTEKKTTHARSTNAPSRRIMLNQALAQLERGHIKVSQTMFEGIVESTSLRWDGETLSTINCYATGYLALCYHLSDNYTAAKSHYADVITSLEARGFVRAQSIFRRHYADLLRAMSKTRGSEKLFKQANNELKAAEELAMGIRAVDLQNYALIARARMNRDLGDRGQALSDLRHAEKYARNLGIRKMLSEVLKVRGEVLLAEGEATQAGFVTSQSIALSKRNGMRLRKISAVLIQAQILKMRQQRVDAKRLLKESLREAQTLGYATKTSTAIQLLSDL